LRQNPSLSYPRFLLFPPGHSASDMLPIILVG
jgi:hypothetical protein